MQFNGRRLARQLAGRLPRSSEHDLQPQLKVLPHGVGKRTGVKELGGEVPLDPRWDVLDQELCFGENVEGGGDGAVVAASAMTSLARTFALGVGARVCSIRSDWITALR